MGKWMIRKLRDDHVSDKEEYRPHYQDCLIGVLCFPGRLPQLVSCGQVDYNQHLCLNQVYAGEEMHLGTFSLSAIDGDQLKELKVKGKVILNRIMGDPTLMLLEEVE